MTTTMANGNQTMNCDQTLLGTPASNRRRSTMEYAAAAIPASSPASPRSERALTAHPASAAHRPRRGVEGPLIASPWLVRTAAFRGRQLLRYLTLREGALGRLTPPRR